MTQTAERLLANDAPLGTESAEPKTEAAAELPVIKPEMAKLLELTQANGSTTTAKEINAQLDRVLREYDELTALYAENNRRIDDELATIRQSGGVLSSRLHQLGADLQQQGESLAARAAAAEHGIAAVREETGAALIDSERRWDSQLTSSNARIHSELIRLDDGLGSLENVFAAQEQILAEQRARLDQFDITYQLLDTATRSNKSRIEAVREQAEKQHAIVEARVDGLSALQREHYAEFQNLQGLVGVLRSETERLDDEIRKLASSLADHRAESQETFKRTHWAIAGVLVLAMTGFALVKWVPAFAPAGTEAALAQQQSRIAEVGSQVAALSARDLVRQETDARQQATIDQVSATVSGLEKSLGDLRTALRKLHVQGAAGTGVLRDSSWLLRQNPKAYTVQLVTSPSQGDMARFIDRHVEQLALDSLAFSVTSGERGARYNLFFGVFATVGQARAAIAALPAELQVNRPWVRQFQSVQEALR